MTLHTHLIAIEQVASAETCVSRPWLHIIKFLACFCQDCRLLAPEPCRRTVYCLTFPVVQFPSFPPVASDLPTFRPSVLRKPPEAPSPGSISGHLSQCPAHLLSISVGAQPLALLLSRCQSSATPRPSSLSPPARCT